MAGGEIWVVSALFLLGGYVVYTGAFQVGLTKEQGGISAGVLPTIAGAGLSAICLLLLLRRQGAPSVQPASVWGFPGIKRWLVFAVLVAAVPLLDILGFALTAGLVVYVLAAWVERSKQVTSLLYGAIVTAGVWLVFDAFIGVPLPQGLAWPG